MKNRTKYFFKSVRKSGNLFLQEDSTLLTPLSKTEKDIDAFLYMHVGRQNLNPVSTFLIPDHAWRSITKKIWSSLLILDRKKLSTAANGTLKTIILRLLLSSACLALTNDVRE